MIRALAAVCCLAVTATGCGDDVVTVDVFAASSLTDAFSELEERYEEANPDVDIRLNLAGSDTLRRQIDDGADADVLAPAALELFNGLGAEPLPYATNQLEIITIDPEVAARVAAGDFAGLLIARCASGVPCGDAADEFIDASGFDFSDATVTSEANVRAVSAKVELGEADVGLVYRTDAVAAGDAVFATGITGAEASVVLAIAALDTDGEAGAFVDFVLEQREVFDVLGFGPRP